ncbi:MAG: DUF2207 domain-containing protein [Candidatus Shapirobacteria bacterium]|nr:DUF2207 domain-containing protein [Candidatus Shapirobacteria bacterium]
MRKVVIGLWLALWLVVPEKILAQSYSVDNFNAEIQLNQDTSLSVKETIETTFLEQKHGIFRIIPYIYSAKGKTITTNLTVIGVADETGKPIPYTVTNFNQSKKIQIGDANKLIFGKQNYAISYRVTKVIQDYGDGPELYWNVTGTEWDAAITKAEAVVTSNFADITKVECFGCVNTFDKTVANFNGQEGLSVVVGLDKNNQLIMPNSTVVVDNWGYGAAILPLLVMFLAWFLKGRDKRYLTENVYYQPTASAEGSGESKEKNVPLLSRPHLPLVYSPIDGLSPSEVGTIIDEKVDTKDIVAEMVELARLGYYTIEKIESKVLWMTNRDYKLTKIEKSTDGLKEYQKYLWESLFDSNNEVKISDLKDHFYIHLAELRRKIYQDLDSKKMTDGDISKVKMIWSGWATLLNVGAGLSLFMVFIPTTGNAGPLVPFFAGALISFLMANKMPRKTAWGYSLSRQAEGLKYYLGKGKWREEISEKRLFLEEMLPLAISLGVVNKLAADMRDLEIEPPRYFQGVVLSNFVSDINHFNSVAGTGLVSAPTHYSGSGSWSGGSGFSGGGGGGGFGGGGGGSW